MPFTSWMSARRDVASRYLDVAREWRRLDGRRRSAPLLRLLLCRLRDGHGPENFALFGLDRKDRAARAEYLTFAEIQALQVRVNPASAREIVDDKLSFFRRCAAHGLPTPDVLAVIGEPGASTRAGGDDPRAATTRVEPFAARSADELGRWMAHRLPAGAYVLKPAHGAHGAGVVALEHDGDGRLRRDGGDFDLRSAVDATAAHGDVLLLQPRLVPHEGLAPVMPGSALGTLRIITLRRNDDDVGMLMCCARLPGADSVTDNFDNGRANTVVCEVDLDGHRLGPAFGKVLPGGSMLGKVRTHPSTGTVIEGFEFPRWDEIERTVLAGARAFPELVTIGWDVALASDGPTLIEANARYGCDLLQVALDRGLRSDFERWLAVPARRSG